MSKRYQFSEKQISELKALRKRVKDKNAERRINALLLYAAGEKCERIAEQTGFVKTYVWELVSKYSAQGLRAIAGGNYGGNHRNMSYAEEKALLEPFRKAAKAGQIVETSEIRRAYEEKIGRSLDNAHGQIYDVLRRHGWSKAAPRGKHPGKADEGECDAGKKQR